MRIFMVFAILLAVIPMALPLPAAAVPLPTDSVNADGAVMTAAEDWNIDTKIDDGNPATGQVVVSGPDANTLTNCTDAGSNAATTANYLLSGTNKSCALVFRNEF